jgi:OOP family OmpA-OmpF porin
MADALFPVMGPAIRRAISYALAGLIQSFNRSLEHTFSLQGLKWRWEALRTGRSFGEVVLRHSLVFRVEQLLLVHRETGVLLQHVTQPDLAMQAPDMVAGMLTAIQDFARDSFQMGHGELLERFQVGELTVWLEPGGHTLLAAVIRGHAPVGYRRDMQQALEAIEANHAADLASFNGDASLFNRSRSRLEQCLQMEEKGTSRPHPWRIWLLLGLLAAALMFWLVPRTIQGRRFDRLVAALRQEPGIVVTHAGRANGGFEIEGLRDPLARNPEELAVSAGLSADQIQGRWQPYAALLPQFVRERARRALNPPPTVSFSIIGDTMVAQGAASEPWVERARTLAPALGLAGFRYDPVNPRDLPAMVPLIQAVESTVFRYGLGSDVPDAAGLDQLAPLVQRLQVLDSTARASGLAARLVIIGSADDLGSAATNLRLMRARADGIVSRLNPAVPATLELAPQVSDSALTPTSNLSEAERTDRRRVSFQIELSPLP